MYSANMKFIAKCNVLYGFVTLHSIVVKMMMKNQR